MENNVALPNLLVFLLSSHTCHVSFGASNLAVDLSAFALRYDSDIAWSFDTNIFSP
jgi:hypothetical protein